MYVFLFVFLFGHCESQVKNPECVALNKCLLFVCPSQQEQLESAQREIAMGNERERQLQGKLLKAKEELKFEREEVCSVLS